MANENEKRETVADIVAILRANARGERFDEFSFTSLADRIEAAWKREARAIATEHAVLPAVCITKPSGNAAALRESCEKMLSLLMLRGDGKAYCILSWDEFNDSQKMLRAALSAPARNCDLFDNWYDAHQAWERLPKDELGYFIKANGVHECEQAWLFAPAAERKGEGDAT